MHAPMTIEHAALWVSDLERARVFYTDVLGGICGRMYENPATGLRSYFVSFGDGARLELMSRPDLAPSRPGAACGYAHLAFRLGSREAVDQAAAELRGQGVPVASPPRQTGDGYYEAVILDPEANPIELLA